MLGGDLPAGRRRTVPEAELWIDDIRLASPVSEPGTALALDARLAASDVGTFNASYTCQNGQFRRSTPIGPTAPTGAP